MAALGLLLAVLYFCRYVISKIHSSSFTRNDTGGATAGTIFIHRLPHYTVLEVDCYEEVPM